MGPRLTILAVAGIFGTTLCGCVAPLACPDSSCAPAVFVRQTSKGRWELVHAVNEALHARTITLPNDALTIVPILIIDRTPVRDQNGVLLNGRELTKPAVFRLYARQSRCVLVHEQSGREWSLRQVLCRGSAE
jgi:hypothetical protein